MRVVIGFHAIEEAVKNEHPGAVLYLNRSSHKRNDQLMKLAAKHKVKIIETSVKELDNLSDGMNHRGAVLLTGRGKTSSKQQSFTDFLNNSENSSQLVVLALDGVTDPQNLGAVMRSADLFSIDLLILPERRSATVNQTVLKVSSGAAEYVPYVVVPNLVRALQELQARGFWVYGADMQGKVISEVNLTGKAVVVLGAEGKGISRLAAATCDNMVSIPTKGHIDSLNISVAAGIIMYEINRQLG